MTKPVEATWQDVAEDRLRELSEAQCTIAEISGALACEYDMSDEDADSFVGLRADVVLRHQLRGRAELRSLVHEIASGRAWGKASKMTRTNIAALDLFGRQHLGYTHEGMDRRVRKEVERAERIQAKGIKRGGLRLADKTG